MAALIKMVLDKPWSLSHKKPFSWTVTQWFLTHTYPVEWMLLCATHIAQASPLQWVQRFQLLGSTASLGLRLQALGNRKVNTPPQLPSQQPSTKTEIILHWDNPRIHVMYPDFPSGLNSSHSQCLILHSFLDVFPHLSVPVPQTSTSVSCTYHRNCAQESPR